MNTLRQEKRLASEAADWVTRLEVDDSLDCRNGFYAWLCESPAHIRTYLETTALTLQLSDVGRDGALDVQTLGTDTQSNVIHWNEAAGGTVAVEVENSALLANTGSAPRSSRPKSVWLALAAATVLCTGLPLLMHLNDHAYRTDVGEQRTIKLEDGSVVTLNTRSRMEVNFSQSIRRVTLLDGEALFAVVRDADRPFQVITDSVTVQVLGTQFNVQRRDESTTVSVIDGSVRLLEASGGAHRTPAQVSAGEEAKVGRDGLIVKQFVVDAAAPVAWRARRILFRETPLSEMAAGFNRYNRIQIRVEGNFGDEQRFTGGFDADNLPALLKFLERDRRLAIERGTDEILIRRR